MLFVFLLHNFITSCASANATGVTVTCSEAPDGLLERVPRGREGLSCVRVYILRVLLEINAEDKQLKALVFCMRHDFSVFIFEFFFLSSDGELLNIVCRCDGVKKKKMD